MIHLDASLLIAVANPNVLHAPTADRLINTDGAFAASACAWTEFKSRPIDPNREKVLHRILTGGIIPFDQPVAAPGGEFTWLALEAPHSRVLGQKTSTILRPDIFTGTAPTPPDS